MADTVFEKFNRCAKLWFFFSYCAFRVLIDWGRQTPITWLYLCLRHTCEPALSQQNGNMTSILGSNDASNDNDPKTQGAQEIHSDSHPSNSGDAHRKGLVMFVLKPWQTTTTTTTTLGYELDWSILFSLLCLLGLLIELVVVVVVVVLVVRLNNWSIRYLIG